MSAQPFQRVVLVVLDSVGVGDAPDAAVYGDAGANTLGNIGRAMAQEGGALVLPHLARLGLGHLCDLPGVPAVEHPIACFGRLTEMSAGKDTTTGHWEIAGLRLSEPFATFPDGFPDEILEAFTKATGHRPLGNVAASGTAIVEALGEEHLATGRPIVYTSADSVFQIAAHEEHFGLDELDRCCRAARAILDPWRVGRVISRPFLGEHAAAFQRTPRRHDYSLSPPRPTVLDRLVAAEVPVVGVGKIHDIFAGSGVSEKVPTASNAEGVARTLQSLRRLERGLIFTNLVDFDMLYGHRRDVQGYARCLEAFDAQLPRLLAALGPDDVLILTADHGNDPTRPGSDHTRERVPLLVATAATRDGKTPARDLGTGTTYANIAATVAEIFRLDTPEVGQSFLGKLLA